MSDLPERPISSHPDLEELADHRREARLRLVDLEERADDVTTPASDPDVLEELLDELHRYVEEQEVAEEELRAQARQLEDTVTNLAEDRRHLRDLFDHAPICYVVTDADGAILEANRRMAVLLGINADQLRRKPLPVYVAGDERAAFRKWLRHLQDRRRPATTEVTLVARDGASYQVELIAAAYGGGEAGDGTISVRWIIRPLESGPEQAVSVPDEPGVELAPGESHPLRVALLAGDRLSRHGLAMLLDAARGDREIVTTEPDEGESCSDHVLRVGADVAVVAVDGPDGGRRGADVVRELAAGDDGVAVVALTPGGDDNAVRCALAAGARGVLTGDVAAEQVVSPVLAVADGWSVLPAPGVRTFADELAVLGRLGDEMRQLWRLVASGARDAEIAADWHVSTRTVKRRVSQLYDELGVGDRIGAAALAGRVGLLDTAPGSD